MTFSEFPDLETERLQLRRMTLDDAASLFDILANSDVTRDMGIEPFVNVGQAEGLIRFMNDLFEQNIAFRCGIFRKDNNALMGTCGYNGWETNRGSRGEIAYDLGKAYWRRGYATEAVEALIKFGFETMRIYRIEAFTNLDATPSIRLLRKLGFQEDGILRGYANFHGEFWDQRCFSLIRKDRSFKIKECQR